MTARARIERLAYATDTALHAARLAGSPWFMLLDSCRHRGGRGRFDIVVNEPREVLVTREEVTEIKRDGVVTSSLDDPFKLIDSALERLGEVTSELPFAGGAVGYFGYDLGRRIERLPALARRDIDLPEMAIGIYEHAVVVDHDARESWLVSHPRAVTSPDALRQAWQAHAALTPAAFGTSFEVVTQVQPELTFAQYAAAWRQIKHYIEAGDVYQVNLTQRFSATTRGSPWDAYMRLRNLNPAPYSAFIGLPQGAILSSSPERFIAVAEGCVETKPIKGTRPRGSTPARDDALRAELAASEKDRAENVMIVDLLRNDLGKTCAVGTVTVPELFAIESYATVHHLVSTVRGRLAPGHTPVDVLRGCFPGGSITGAPKIRAMEIIEHLEPSRRGVYCGALGYVSCHGRMDTNIAIRTLVHQQDRLFCWAGGGIVMDSELDAEYQECFTKAAAMLEVFADAEIIGLGR